MKKTRIIDLCGKVPYEAPSTQVVEVEIEGTIAASGGRYNGFHNDGEGNEEYEW